MRAHTKFGIKILEIDFVIKIKRYLTFFFKLEDLKVLKGSPDLLNNVKIGQGHQRLNIQTYFVSLNMGSGHFDPVT